MKGRKPEIDFLRGIAVILVLFRHRYFWPPLMRGGWMGVDLFFVLSGFLVSGLLFREFQKSGKIKPVNFLVRRGFKIYPQFYVFLGLYILLMFKILHRLPPTSAILSEAFFVQNYFDSFCEFTWSLAVEEHFYFSLAILMFLAMKFNWISSPAKIGAFIGTIFILCLTLRFINAQQNPFTAATHQFPTHLRIDSLLMGVLISMIYHFQPETFRAIFSRGRTYIYLLAGGIIVLPFIINIDEYWMYTLGFSLLFLAFGAVLSLFLTDERIVPKLQKIVSKPIFSIVCWVGYYSYSIYLMHMIVRTFGMGLLEFQGFEMDTKLGWLVFAAGSCFGGWALATLIDRPSFKIRDRFFPKID